MIKRDKIILDMKDIQILIDISRGERLCDIADKLAIRASSLTARLQSLESVDLLSSKSMQGIKHVKIMYSLTDRAYTLLRNTKLQLD